MASDPPETGEATSLGPHPWTRHASTDVPTDNNVGLGPFSLPSDEHKSAGTVGRTPASPLPLAAFGARGAGPPNAAGADSSSWSSHGYTPGNDESSKRWARTTAPAPALALFSAGGAGPPPAAGANNTN